MPPRIPQFNWVDLGLPSGTLWLDRLVGAPSPTEAGLFYQWGGIVGRDIASSYQYTAESYQAQGLNLITSDLDDAHDAARAYYGPTAKMPTTEQFQELIDNCDITYPEQYKIILTSRINGSSIKLRHSGYKIGVENLNINDLCAWSSEIDADDQARAYWLHSSPEESHVSDMPRPAGANIMAVHS